MTFHYALIIPLHIKFTRKNNFIPSVYFIKNAQISETQTIKDLGITIDNRLTFVPHMDSLIKKASRMLGFVIRFSRLLKKPTTKIILYNCLVRSMLEYGSVVWRPHFATHMLRIERVQKRFVRHLAYSFNGVNRDRYSYTESLDYFKISDLNTRRDAIDLVFLYKLVNYHIYCPHLLSKLSFTIPRKIPRKPIRLFAQPRRRTKLGSNSPIARLTSLYNMKCSVSTDIDIFKMSKTAFKKAIQCM